MGSGGLLRALASRAGAAGAGAAGMGAWQGHPPQWQAGVVAPGVSRGAEALRALVAAPATAGGLAAAAELVGDLLLNGRCATSRYT